MKSLKVISYIDGFNLYFGMRDAGFTDLKWLDVVALSRSFIGNNQTLTQVKYFTSMVSNDPAKEKRQRTYLDAITAKGATIIRGKYESKKVECSKCLHTWNRTNEKMTDVNIATNLIMDAMNGIYDVAFLMSGDSDLVPAINAVNNHFAPKFVTTFYPPMRQNMSVGEAARGASTIGRKRLKDSQLPEQVESLDGYLLKKPSEW